jgi:uncharacterized protein with GYD domain
MNLLGSVDRLRINLLKNKPSSDLGSLTNTEKRKGDEMPIYVVLGNFTQKRIETIKNLPEGIKESKKLFESYGVKVLHLVFTLGRYDVVAIGEAPNEEAITKALLSWGSKGLLRTETLTGFTPEKMIELVKEI